MREPVFNETVQLGIVVRDLEATVRRYVDDYGIGPWEFAQIDAGARRSTCILLPEDSL
jgi:methylmalonyl-CoA/ethylmalonyl-CoA epimerase